MAMTDIRRRLAAVGLAIGLAALLSTCFLSPGKFDARLDLKRDGSLHFAYTGQIYLLALSKLADLANKAEADDGEFVAQPCYEEEKFEERPCSDGEIQQQRQDWETARTEKSASADKETEAMRALLGGIDPADPAAARELTERLRRQEGWRKVEYMGDGLFEVDFSIDSELSHDFAFPTFERFPMGNFFVMANLRAGNVVRIDAPAFAAQGAGNPFQGMMSGMAGAMGAFAADEKDSDALPLIPEMDGTFTVTTDGVILANNTDEGLVAGPAGKVLTWKVNKRTPSPPTALIQLAPKE
jgi:hypothetical protein